jgi:hypothetical protein
MQTLTNQGRPEQPQPDAIRVAHDVNQAMYDVLTPHPVEPGQYDLALVPQHGWSASENDWATQLTAIFQRVRRKYPVLAQRPSSQDVTATLIVPISFTHQLVVGRIFAPSVRPGGLQAHRSRPVECCKAASTSSRLQIDFDVHRAIVQTLVPRRIAEDEYSVRLKPSSCAGCPDSWARDLTDIQAALRKKYGRLEIADVFAAAASTYNQPLSNTKDRIVEEILGAGIWFPIG